LISLFHNNIIISQISLIEVSGSTEKVFFNRRARKKCAKHAK